MYGIYLLSKKDLLDIVSHILSLGFVYGSEIKGIET